MAQAVIEEYTTSLDDLTFNSKPHINALTMLAEEYLQHADLIVRVIETKLQKAPSTEKLPLMYLMDSIVKNVGGNYKPLFAKNIVKSFYSTFEKGDEKIKMSLYKLRSTWDNYFPLKKLYELDVTVQKTDSNWPVKPLPASLQDKPSSSIHVNPKFLKKGDTAVPRTQSILQTTQTSAVSSGDSVDLKQDLINKQKQLLELQQQKLLLELEQTKQQLAMREKRTTSIPTKPTPKDPRVKLGGNTTVPSLKVTVPNGQKMAAAKDPRSAVPKPKPNVSVAVKKTVATSDPRLKQMESKKNSSTNSDKVKSELKKSPSGLEKTQKRKKASPNNAGKTNLKSGKIISPKSEATSENTKKTKVTKKKGSIKAAKTVLNNKAEEKSKVEQSGSSKPPPRDAPKRKERPVRRSPPRGRPAKQARRSTSVERQRSSSPPRAVPQQRAPRPVTLREEELRHESPRSHEGSLSPRFSPEPDDVPPGRKQGWRPPFKRMRQQEPPSRPGPWRPGDRMPGHDLHPLRRRSSVDPNVTIPQELTLSHQAEILKQADIQLQSGQLTHGQHQDLLKQLHQLFELQRLRNFAHTSPDGRVPLHPRRRMPLDEVLPENRNEAMMLRDQVNFRPDFPMQQRLGDRPPAFRPPPSPPRMDVDRVDEFRPRNRPLTPPPLPPDPRGYPQPRREDPRRHDDRFRYDQGPSATVEGPRKRNVGPPMRPQRRPPSPGVRRGSWGNSSGPNRNDYGQDLGDVFVLEEDENYAGSPHQGPQIRHRDDAHPDLQNGTKQPPERVPLRAYAHPDSDNDVDSRKRRKSFEEGQNRDLRRAQMDEPERHSPERVKNDINEKDGPHLEEPEDYIIANIPQSPQLEEPEDYIIANIPPGAEAYHEHSMTLKTGKSAVAFHEHKKNLLAKKLSSDKVEDSDSADKALENIQSEGFSSPDASRKTNADDEMTKSPSLPLKKRKYLISSSDMRDSSDGGAVTEPDPDAEQSENDKVESVRIKEETEIKDGEDKSENVDENKQKQEVEEENVADSDGGKEAIEDIKEIVENKPGGVENPAKSLSAERERPGPLKKQEKKRNRRRARERPDARLARIQQLAETPKPEEGPAPFPRKMTEEESLQDMRLQSLMQEEEERLRWEAELEMQLGREEFFERQGRHRVGRRSPPGRWGRGGHDGPWRGRGGPGGRGRGGWPRDEHWNEEPGFRGRMPRPSGRLLPPPPSRGERIDDWDRPWDGRRPGLMRGPAPSRPERPHPALMDDRTVDDVPRGPPKQQQPAEQAQAEMNQVNVNKLLSDLLNMGIIPGPSKVETPTSSASAPNVKPPTISASPENTPAPNTQEELSSVPIVSKGALSLETNRVPTPVFEDVLTLDPDSKLPEIKLSDTSELKIRHEEVIKRLYTGIQCSACGMRFTACQTDMYAEHLDWHYRLNRKDKDGVKESHRMLYPTAGEWIMYEEIVDPAQRAKNEVFEEAEEEALNNQNMEVDNVTDPGELVVPVAQNPEQDKCSVCNEAFKTVYNDEEEEWQYVNCVAVDGQNFHPNCYADHNDDAKDMGPLPTPVRVPIYNPIEVSLKGIPGLDSLISEEQDSNENRENIADLNAEAAPNTDQVEPLDPGENVTESADVNMETEGSAKKLDEAVVSEPQQVSDMPSLEEGVDSSQDVPVPTDQESQDPATGAVEVQVADDRDDLPFVPGTQTHEEPYTGETTGEVTDNNLALESSTSLENIEEQYPSLEKSDSEQTVSETPHSEAQDNKISERMVDNNVDLDNIEKESLSETLNEIPIAKNESPVNGDSDIHQDRGNQSPFVNEITDPSQTSDPGDSDNAIASISENVSSPDVTHSGLSEGVDAFATGEPLPPGTVPVAEATMESRVSSDSEDSDEFTVTI